MAKGNWIAKWGHRLLVWGKPIIRSLIKNQLLPELKKKINAGAVDAAVDKKIEEVVNAFCKKYL